MTSSSHGRFDRVQSGPERRDRVDHGAGATGTDPCRLDVAKILAVDEEYRRRVRLGTLRAITMRYRGSERTAIPVLEGRWGCHFVVAHRDGARRRAQGRSEDDVLVYAYTGDSERTYRVCTAARGPLRGKRIVRGHAHECDAHYRTSAAPG